MPRPKPNVYLRPSLFVEMGRLGIYMNIPRADVVELACEKFIELFKQGRELEVAQTPAKREQPKQLQLQSRLAKQSNLTDLEEFAKKILSRSFGKENE
jgi:hypothetical protein